MAMTERHDRWDMLLAAWADYLEIDSCEVDVGIRASILAEALHANVTMVRLLDAHREDCIAEAFNDPSSWQLHNRSSDRRANKAALLADWGTWQALAAAWADHQQHREAAAAARHADRQGNYQALQHHREIAAMVTPLSPVDALAVTTHMIKHLDAQRDVLIHRARTAGLTSRELNRLLR